MGSVLESFQIRLDTSRREPSAWDFVAAHPTMLLHCENQSGICSLRNQDAIARTWDNPLEAIDWMEQHALNLPADSSGRWIGYFSYDLGRFFEKLPASAQDELHLPLFQFAFCHSATDQKRQTSTAPAPAVGMVESNFSRELYCRAVERVIDYIRAGDVFQVNLSQRFAVPSSDTPAAIYNRLKQNTPAWYGGLLDFGDHALICNSPELFLKIDPDRRVTTRPIKGTRPLGSGMEQDLRDSAKDQAELNMIVDLERNDLGRVCEIGSVKVTAPRSIETHPTVYHGVATIEGILRQDVSLSDLLRATFPGGSVTGAPKIRAMEVIEELEGVRRGPYCGAIGYLAAGGHMEFNVAIRTMIVKAAHTYISVGGGIVADSIPDAEYEETLVKARAMFAALGST
jgi:aminodeoxychorismate synthase component I